VVKSDNGSAFRDGRFQALLRRWQVWLLYSPPGRPGYNGAIEASIGSLKRRTQHQAERHGHAGVWTSADLESARALANATARPRGPCGPTPEEAWAARRPLRQAEREAFATHVRQLEAATRQAEGLALEEELDHYEQAALHRRVLQQALVEHGILSITRRSIPQRIYGQKAAII
jgi:hypothetical protein